VCGIVGITSNDDTFVSEYLKIIKHRGPDGQGIWSDGQITLGHNLLAITDKPHLSKQPYITPKENILIYNGEIFNYYELLKKYSNFIPKTDCDTELLAWGLDNLGIAFLNEIDSMHSLAYYDKEYKKLYLSIDHAGIKPLYYAQIKEGLVFGSEVKGLIDKVPNSNKIDPMAMSCFSLSGLNVTSHSFFSGIKKVMSGETLCYNLHHNTLKQVKRILPRATSDYKFDPFEFRHMMNKTVKMCSIGKREIGVFLSGGLDSSAIAYELNKIKGSARTFTNMIHPMPKITHEDFNSDHDCALELALRDKFNHEVIKITPDIYVNNWDNAVYYMEEPVYNLSLPMYNYTNKFLSEKGIVVTMAGDLGDEVLGGYPKYYKLGKQFGNAKQDWRQIVKQWMFRLSAPLKLPKMEYSYDDVIDELIKTTFPESLQVETDNVASYMMLDIVGQCPEEFFRRNDRYGMQYSMEGRFPLATKMFINYAMSIHTKDKIGATEADTKLLPKIAYKGLLTDNIINKKKTGWTAPIREWQQQNLDNNVFETMYQNNLKSTEHKIEGLRRHNKGKTPALACNDWARQYQMTL
tara:strand:+ start:3808 stop:5538 length:1731 start_codon:yes stop_codon:yes gene_type:complete